MLHYETILNQDKKEWVVFLHGLGGSSTLFYKQKEQFAQHYNLLFIDLPGHGKSEGFEAARYTAREVVEKITELMKKLKIEKAHFFTFSLGTIIGNEILHSAKHMVKTMVLAGPVLRIDKITKFLIDVSWLFKKVLPYLTLYKIFALLIMPKKEHKVSRKYFVQEAAKLGRAEFLKWVPLLADCKKQYLQSKGKNKEIPKLYLIGQDDHLFIKATKKAASEDDSIVYRDIQDSGHVCLIEKPAESNEIILDFIEKNNPKENR